MFVALSKVHFQLEFVAMKPEIFKIFLFLPLICSSSSTEDQNEASNSFHFELPKGLKAEERFDSGCGFHQTFLRNGDKGEILTPNYPLGYPPRLECIWWLKVNRFLPYPNIYSLSYIERNNINYSIHFLLSSFEYKSVITFWTLSLGTMLYLHT